MTDQQLQLDHFESLQVTRPDSRGRLKTREVFRPDEEARYWHDAMLQTLYEDGLVDNPWAIGGMPGKQLIDNVMPHADSRTFYMLDISNAFPSVSIAKLKMRLLDAATDADQRTAYEEFMDLYATTYKTPGLPQGAPCSPYLFNFYCQEMDFQLGAFCNENDLAYTRWLDDFTISSPAVSGVLGDATRRSIRTIIETSGLSINHAKSRLHRRTNMPVTITGISLYPNGRIQPSPQILEKMFNDFATIEAELVAATTELEINSIRARLNGWNGMLMSMSEPGAEATPILIRGKEVYHKLSSVAVALIGADVPMY